MKKESDAKSRVRAFARTHDIGVATFATPSWPDLLLVGKGKALYIEMKRHSKSMYKVSTGQKLVLQRLERNDQHTMVLYGDDDIEGILNKFFLRRD